MWHSENIALLTGDHYRVQPPRQSTITLEHVSGWAWGDMFGFVDMTHFHHSDGAGAIYGEWSPRLSLSWLTDQSLSVGPVSDVLIAGTFEVGSGDVEALLLGPGISLTVPGFDFVNLSLQYELPYYGDSEGWTVTTVWRWQRPVLDTTFVFEGYSDWVLSNQGGSHANLHFNPQVKLDVGPLLGGASGKWYAGVEYDYWSNKFGIKDSAAFPTDQNTVSAMVQLKF